MNTSKIGKNIVLSTLMTLGVIGSIEKIKDYNQNKLYKTLTATNIEPKQQTSQDQQILTTSDDHSTNTPARVRTAEQIYKTQAFPIPGYETHQDFLQILTQKRIQYSLHPGQHFPTGIEEYPHHVIQAQGTAALCATGSITQLKMANTRSPEMRHFFGKTGKNTWNLEQMLTQYGRKSIVNSVDSRSYYDTRSTSGYALPHHYDNLLQAATTSSANDIFTVRYAHSGSLAKAKQENKNGTHTLRSLGTITQNLSFKKLGLQGNNLTIFQKSSPHEQQLILLYHIIAQRDFTGSVGSYDTERSRIEYILTTYPDLIKVSRQNEEATFKGTMVDHVYPTNKVPTNYIHYLFELIAYRGSNKDGSLFLLCDGLTPGPQALKYQTYNNISQLYTQIENIRNQVTQSEIIGSTYIVNFDDIDLNNNKIIDKTDKTIGEVVDEISSRRWKNHTQGQGLTLAQTRSYLMKYRTILGAAERFPTGTVVPLPLLKPSDRTLINTTYDHYIKVFEEFRQESRDNYYKHLTTHTIPNITSNTILTQQGVFIYPTCLGDDEITITQQVCSWIDDIALYNKDLHLQTQLHQFPREAFQDIHNLIKPAIHYKNTKTIQPGQTITIDLYHAVSLLKEYINDWNAGEHNYLPLLDRPVFNQFDKVMENLHLSSSNRTIINHYLLRETSGQIGFFDITKWRSWKKYMAEKTGFDDNLSWIKEIESQGPLQIRLSYFINGENDEINKVLQSCKDIQENTNINLSKKDNEKLIHLSRLLEELIYANISKDKTVSTQKKKEILHELSHIIDFNPSSLETPEKNLGTLISILLTDQQINKYKYQQTKTLKHILQISELTSDHINFLQEFSYLTHHYGHRKGNQYLHEALNFYLKKKSVHNNYTLSQLSEEPDLQYMYHYINSIPPQSDHESAGVWMIVALLGGLGLLSTNKKQKTEK